MPSVGADWAPYRAGQWVWEPYWGWTWVSSESWGWAPYHYGRWFLYGSSWAWWPGPLYGGFYRPIWAPAYVSFFGFGRGFGVGYGGYGSFGWLPIGPCDRFFPWWGGYRGRFNAVNFRNGNFYHRDGFGPLHGGNRYSNVRLASTNARIRGAVSTVRSGEFGRGRVTARPVSRDAFRNGKMVTGNLPVVPNRQSLSAGARRAAPANAGRGSQQHFFGSNRSTPAPRSFDREAASVRNSIQRDGHVTPVTGNSRSTAGESNSHSIARQNGLGSGGTRSNDAVGRNQVGSGTGIDRRGESAGSGNSGQSWRGQPQRSAGSSNAGPGASTPGSGRPSPGHGPGQSSSQRSGQQNSDWRRGSSGGPSQSAGGGSPVNTNRPANGGMSQDRGSDWRRMTPTQTPGRNSAPQTQRDSGGWRNSAPRDSGRGYSRPSLDMRQPIVTQRSWGGPSGGNSGGYRGGGGGGRSAPSPSPSRGGGGSGGGGGHSGGGGGHSGGGGGGGGGGHSGGGGGGGGGGHSAVAAEALIADAEIGLASFKS